MYAYIFVDILHKYKLQCDYLESINNYKISYSIGIFFNGCFDYYYILYFNPCRNVQIFNMS